MPYFLIKTLKWSLAKFSLEAWFSSSSKTSQCGVCGIPPQPPPSLKPLAGCPVHDSHHHTTVFGSVLTGGMSCLSFAWLESAQSLWFSQSLPVTDKNDSWKHLQCGVITNSLWDIRAQEGKELLDTWRHQAECSSLATHTLACKHPHFDKKVFLSKDDWALLIQPKEDSEQLWLIELYIFFCGIEVWISRQQAICGQR